MSDQESESNNPSVNTRRQFYCHECHRRIEALMAPNPTCPHCNGEFVEELEEGNDLMNEHTGGQDSDEEFDDTIHLPMNGQDLLHQLFQMFSLQPGPNVRVQESRDGTTTTTTITATGTRTTTTTEGGASEQQGGDQQQQQHTNRPNIIFAMGGNAQNAGDDRMLPLIQMFQRILDSNGGINNQANNFLNFFNIAGDPRDYVWGNTGLDNIITQLMEQQAGRQAPPPATDEMIENLPKKMISKKQVVEEQLGCPVCKDEFQIDEETVYLPCTHTFHYDCIKPWLKMNGTCPVCRYSLVGQENNEHNAHNNNGAGSSNNNSNNNNFGSIFNSTNSSLPGAYPGNQQNNGQQNQDEDPMEVDHEVHDLD